MGKPLAPAARKEWARLKKRVATAEREEGRAEDRLYRATSKRSDADYALWEFERDNGLLPPPPEPGTPAATAAAIFKKVYAKVDGIITKSHPMLARLPPVGP